MKKKNTPRKNNKPQPSLSFIPSKKFDRLSAKTKNVVKNDVKVSDDSLDITYIVHTIETENNKISHRINDAFGLRADAIPPGPAIRVEKTCGPCPVVIMENKKAKKQFYRTD